MGLEISADWLTFQPHGSSISWLSVWRRHVRLVYIHWPESDQYAMVWPAGFDAAEGVDGEALGGAEEGGASVIWRICFKSLEISYKITGLV